MSDGARHACAAPDHWFVCVELRWVHPVEDRWSIAVECETGWGDLNGPNVMMSTAVEELPPRGTYRNFQGEGLYWVTVAELRGLEAFHVGSGLSFAANTLVRRWRGWSENVTEAHLLPLSQRFAAYKSTYVAHLRDNDRRTQ